MARLIEKYVEDPKTFEFKNKMLVLSGPVSLSLEKTVEILSDVSKRNLSIKKVHVEAYAAQPQVKVCSSSLDLSNT